jgi:hypothetical protein
VLEGLKGQALMTERQSSNPTSAPSNCTLSEQRIEEKFLSPTRGTWKHHQLAFYSVLKYWMLSPEIRNKIRCPFSSPLFSIVHCAWYYTTSVMR